MVTIPDLKNLICGYLSEETGTTLVPGDFVVNTVDMLLLSINSAKRQAQSLNDFFYCQQECMMPIDSNGTTLDDVTDLNAVSVDVKRILEVLVPISGGFIPIEFISNDARLARLRRIVGDAPYSATMTAADFGADEINPRAYQRGRWIHLEPADQFTFPVECRFEAITFLPDYTGAEVDFILTNGWRYLMWKAIQELNTNIKEFVPRQEGNIDSAEVAGFAAEAFGALIAWDKSIAESTTTPDAPPEPPQPSRRRG
jgi:hypothetical protein